MSSSDISPIHLFPNYSPFQPSSQISAASEPDRRLWETADPLVSDSNHSRITTTSQPKNCQIRITASSSPYFITIGALRSNYSLREIADRLCQARITIEPPIHYSRTTSEWNSNHSHIATASYPKHSRITTKIQPNRSYITVDSQPLTAESQPLRNRRSTILFQVLRNRRSICFNYWEFADPYVSIVENSPIHMFQSLRIRRSMCFNLWHIAEPFVSESQPNPIHIRTGSQPRRNRRSTCSRLGSQPNHSHITHESYPNHGRISTAVAQPQDSRVTTSEKSPIHLFQAWVATEAQPHCSRNHSRTTAISQPHQNRITASVKSQIHLFQARTTPESLPHHTRIIATSPPHHSHRTCDSQPLRNSRTTCFRHGPQRTLSLAAAEIATWNTAGPQPYHTRIIAMAGAEPKHSHIAAGTTATSQPHPNHKRITIISQPNHSHTTLESQPREIANPLAYLKFWEIVDPLISKSETSSRILLI